MPSRDQKGPPVVRCLTRLHVLHLDFLLPLPAASEVAGHGKRLNHVYSTAPCVGFRGRCPPRVCFRLTCCAWP